MPRLSLTNPLRLAAIIYGIYRTKKRTPERPFNRASAPKLTVIRQQRLALEPGWTSAVCQRASQSGIEKRPQTGRQKRLREIEGHRALHRQAPNGRKSTPTARSSNARVVSSSASPTAAGNSPNRLQSTGRSRGRPTGEPWIGLLLWLFAARTYRVPARNIELRSTLNHPPLQRHCSTALRKPIRSQKETLLDMAQAPWFRRLAR